jgi:hypothetical protein
VAAALDRSGLVERPRFHDLRHCYATWLVSEGVPVDVVQAVMGQFSAFTADHPWRHAGSVCPVSIVTTGTPPSLHAESTAAGGATGGPNVRPSSGVLLLVIR